MEKPPTIRDLYPNLTDEQLIEVEETLDRYLELVLRIFEHLESEGKIDAALKKFESNQESANS